jgi:predicted SAM-dependent methyltransferase
MESSEMVDPMKHLFVSEYFNEQTLASVTDAIHRVHAEKGVGSGGEMFDARRFAITVEYMRKFGLSTGFCVEIGSLKYLSSKVVWGHFPEANTVGTRHDLRHSPMPFLDNSVNNIVCAEVLEHISDISYEQATTLSGLFFFLQECRRVLCPGGRMLISTPNAASLWAIQSALLEKAPMMYEWHFREFTMDEMKQIIGDIGSLKIIEHRSEFSWHLWNFSHLTDFIRGTSFSMKNRGDDQFIVIEKNDSIVPVPHNLNLPLGKHLTSTARRKISIARKMLVTKLRHKLLPQKTTQDMKAY